MNRVCEIPGGTEESFPAGSRNDRKTVVMEKRSYAFY